MEPGRTSVARRIARTRGLGAAAIGARRLALALRPAARALRLGLRWWVTSREVTNFTYDLRETNRGHLAGFLAAVSGAKLAAVLGWMRELEEDAALREQLRRATAASPDAAFSDAEPRYGRRLGWYVLVRALKPGVVVESGVDKGLGACVLGAALARNADEGRPGFYIGLDRNPDAGFLFGGGAARHGELRVGDAIEGLKQIERIDLFIHDSDHSPAHEAREYETLESRLSEGAVVLSDNAHVTGELFAFAQRSGRRFLFFAEQPREHWYAGGGIGAAFP